MTNKLTTEQKQEYLRLLLSDGPEAAAEYLERMEPVRMVFEGDEDLERYIKETGKRPRLAIILPPDDGEQ